MRTRHNIENFKKRKKGTNLGLVPTFLRVAFFPGSARCFFSLVHLDGKELFNLICEIILPAFGSLDNYRIMIFGGLSVGSVYLGVYPRYP
jgi:hypothetical protein